MIAITAIFILAVLAFLLAEKFNRKNSLFDKQMQLATEMENKYKNDTFGGSTPEETLQLFISALKNGDTDLASKYFVIEKQEEWKTKIDKIKENGKLDLMIEDLNLLKKSKNSDNKTSFFILTDKNNVVTVQMIIINSITANRWKIEEL